MPTYICFYPVIPAYLPNQSIKQLFLNDIYFSANQESYFSNHRPPTSNSSSNGGPEDKWQVVMGGVGRWDGAELKFNRNHHHSVPLTSPV